MNKDNNNKFGVGLILGTIVGAIGGMMLSPKSGKENREAVMETFNDLKDSFNDGNLDEKVKGIFGEATAKTKEVYLQATDQMADKLANMKEALVNLDKEKYMTIVTDVVDAFVEEHEIPQESVAKLKKYFQNDYKKIMDHVTEKDLKKKSKTKKTQKLLAGKTK